MNALLETPDERCGCTGHYEPAAGWHDLPACDGWWFLSRLASEGSGALRPTPVYVYTVPGANGQTVLKGVFRHGRDFVVYGMGRWYGPVTLPEDGGSDGG